MRITVLGYADTDNNRIRIPFISNIHIFIIYFYIFHL
jgi:hypothetical protein